MMKKEVFIFEVSEQSFPESVLQNSFTIPVLVEFMGIWSEPCIMMSEMLAKLAKEFAGQFIFAKVDIDEQASLRKQYAIENIPTLLVIQNGEVLRTEVGQLGENELRAILKELSIFRESDEIREHARAKHLAGDTEAAILLLTQAIQKDPANIRVAEDMVQIFIDLGELEQARQLFEKIPEKHQHSDMGKALSGQILFLDLASKTQGVKYLNQQIISEPDNSSARFDLAICQVAGHEYDSALDNLFHIMVNEPDFRQGAAREMIVTIINMLMPQQPDRAQEYRRKLSNMLAE